MTSITEQRNRNRAKISFSKIGEDREGRQIASAEGVELIEDREMSFSGRTVYKDVLRVDFRLANGSIKSKDMILAMTETSQLGQFVKAVKGYLPDHIYDFEKELMYQDLIVDIRANEKDGQTYYNITGFDHINNATDDIIAEKEEKYISEGARPDPDWDYDQEEEYKYAYEGPGPDPDWDYDPERENKKPEKRQSRKMDWDSIKGSEHSIEF